MKLQKDLIRLAGIVRQKMAPNDLRTVRDCLATLQVSKDASAKDAGLDNEINSAVFDRNAKVDFASVLKRMGFLREFSDATQMVGIAG